MVLKRSLCSPSWNSRCGLVLLRGAELLTYRLRIISYLYSTTRSNNLKQFNQCGLLTEMKLMLLGSRARGYPCIARPSSLIVK